MSCQYLEAGNSVEFMHLLLHFDGAKYPNSFSIGGLSSGKFYGNLRGGMHYLIPDAHGQEILF